MTKKDYLVEISHETMVSAESKEEAERLVTEAFDNGEFLCYNFSVDAYLED